MTTTTLIPTFDLATFGGASDSCRAMQGQPATLDAIITAARAAGADAVVCDAEGRAVGAVVGGEYVAAVAAPSYSFGDRVLHLDLGRWRISRISGAGFASRLDSAPMWDVDTCMGQADARAEHLRLLPR